MGSAPVFGRCPCAEFDDCLFGQHDFEALRAPLRARRHAGVVHEVALQNVKLAIGGFKLHHIGFNEDAIDLRGDIVNGDLGDVPDCGASAKYSAPW